MTTYQSPEGRSTANFRKVVCMKYTPGNVQYPSLGGITDCNCFVVVLLIAITRYRTSRTLAWNPRFFL